MKSSQKLWTKLMIIGCAAIGSNTLLALPTLETTTRYLDPHLPSITVKQDHCLHAAPNALLLISPRGENAQRVYGISQVTNIVEQKNNYAKSMEQQIKDNQFIATDLCDGVASISNMQLPFPKGLGMQDANDGVLLAEAARQSMAIVFNYLQTMHHLAMLAADGTNGTPDYPLLDNEYQALLAELDRVAHYSTYNDIPLLDGSRSEVIIPTKLGSKFEKIHLARTTIDYRGLGLANTSLASLADALTALVSLNSANKTVENSLQQLKYDQVRLEKIAKDDAILTTIDLRSNNAITKKSSVLN